MKLHYIAIALAACAAMSSCVSKKAHKQELARREALETRQQELLLEFHTAKGHISALETFNANLTQAVTELQEDKLNLQNDIVKLQGRLNSVSSEKERQQEQYQKELRDKIAELEGKERQIQRIQEAVKARDTRLQGLHDELQTALAGQSPTPTLSVKDGVLTLTLPHALLFRDNTARPAPKAGGVLGLVAGVLGRPSDIRIGVEAHSDSTPPDRKLYKDNWQLTALQAAQVVRVLNEDFYMNPSQLTATGKGAFYPRAANDTRDGRLANQRTEILVAMAVDGVLAAMRE